MTWDYEVIGTAPVGDKFLVWGTWDGTDVTGGDIVTGFTTCESCVLGHTGAAVEASVAVCNETFAKATPAPGSVTVVCTSGDAGTFIAVCR